MNNIILFKSKKHILVEENYNEFIKFCRYQLSGLTQTQDWEQYAWKGYVTFRKIGIGNKSLIPLMQCTKIISILRKHISDINTH
jgi:hypothetical protein